LSPISKTGRSSRPVSRAEFDAMRQQVDGCVRDLAIQFKRISQMQAELDQIRQAWAKRAVSSKRR